ncbi:MAG: cytochrome C [Burkholderiaceae bacterium]|jgi:cytochrome c551/c552|nr:cytochrome C [Burkholderiaceae bacterium]
MKKVAIVVAAAGLLMAGTAQASADLAEKSGCNKCHAVDKKKMGPSYQDIAKKLKGKPDAEIVANLKAGKGHPKQAGSDADLTAVVKWIQAM